MAQLTEQQRKEIQAIIERSQSNKAGLYKMMERKGIRINWIGGDDYNLLKESLVKYLQSRV